MPSRSADAGGMTLQLERTTTQTTTPTALWRAAGVLALAHVVVIMTGLVITNPPLLEDGTAGIRESYAEGNLTRIFAGGYLEVLGFVLVIPVLVFVARNVGRSTELGRWAAQTSLAAGLIYVAITIAVGFGAGAAAAYGVHHGLDLDTALALNNVRNIGYFLSLAVLGASCVGVGVAALQDGFSPRWTGWGGIVTGLSLFTCVPLAAFAAQDLPTLVWTVWWIGVGVQLIRRPD